MSGTPASMVVPSGASGARSIWGLMRTRWRFGPWGSQGATSVMRRSYPTCSTRSRCARRLTAQLPTVPTTHANATMQSLTAVPTLSSRLQERQTVEDRHRRRGRTKLSTAGIEILWSCSVATMERIPPPKPRRNEDALREAAGTTPYGKRLRPPGRGASGPYRRSERLHRARHPCHRARRISLSGKGEPRPSPDLCNRAVQSELINVLIILDCGI